VTDQEQETQETPPDATGDTERDGEPEATPEPTEPLEGADDEPGEADDTQQAPPVAIEHRTAAQIEAAAASWDREKNRHMNELEKRDDVRFGDTVECPLCDGHGRIYPILPEPEQSNRREFITAALGGMPEVEYKPHPTEVLCDQCDGWGKVFTGSHVANQDLLNCPACGGMGHRAKIGAPAVPVQTWQGVVEPGPVPQTMPFSTVPYAEQIKIGNDVWGRPPGDPHYAIPPVSPNAQPAYAGQT